MENSRRIDALIRPTVEAMGFRLVRVQFIGGDRPSLQIMAEDADGKMSIDDCARISRAISAVLDVEDPIAGPYALEVSSPGIDRPLISEDDFRRFAGFQAKVEMGRPIDGRRRFKGRLRGLEDGMVGIESEKETHELPYQDITKAKLILTDDLIAASKGGPGK